MAAQDSAKILTKLANLSSSLDGLESLLEPLLAQSLPETILELEPLQQAKLQTVLPYVVYDLVFMYLKLEGVDPKTHPVIAELDRIRQYFGKISNTENPPTRKTEIDKEAAGRFIKNAIAQVKWQKTAAETAQEEDEQTPSVPKASASTSKVPVKVTSKMLERQKYEEELKRQDAEDQEEGTLEVYGESMDVDEPNAETKGKASTAGTRQRPVVDPFSGYGDDAEGEASPTTPSSSSQPEQPTATLKTAPSKKKKRKSTGGDNGKKKKSKASS